MKKTITGVIIAVGAAGVYLVYKNWDKILAKLQGDKNQGGGTESGADPESGYQALPYAKKVEELQLLLQIKPSGFPGKQTNGTLDFYYDAKRNYSLPEHVAYAQKNNYPNLKSNGKGVVSESNVDFYIDQVKNAQTPRQKAWKEKPSGYADAAALARANYGKSLEAKIKSGQKVTAKQYIQAPEYRFDPKSQTYVKTGILGYWTAGAQVAKDMSFDYSFDGWWILESPRSRGSFSIVNPYLFQ